MNFADKAISDFVAERRARTGRKFETVERMKSVFADLDAAGWNDWPPPSETIISAESRETIISAEVAETISAVDHGKGRETISAVRRGRPRRGEEGNALMHARPWESAGVSRATWYRRRAPAA